MYKIKSVPKLKNLSFKSINSQNIEPTELAIARKYIDNYWQNLIKFNPKDNGTLIGLPNPYLVPSSSAGREFDFNEMFYWDSYFMVQGLYSKEQNSPLIHGILDNLIFLFNKVDIIPNSNHYYMTSRSQPPFLTSYIFEVYERYNHDSKWLKDRMEVAIREYLTVWMGIAKPNARQVYKGLSRYYDYNYINDIAEAESGWDMTPRFGRKALNFLPIDLNSLLFKYEMDFSKYYKIINQESNSAKWLDLANKRRETVDQYMWNRYKGLYYDYDYVKKRRSNVASLASFYPMWAGMVDAKRADVLVKSLKTFIHRGGLSTTDSMPMSQIISSKTPLQWAYPNGWAPLQYIVIKGLKRYGYNDLAQDIALRWIKCNLNWFTKHQIFLEKYNVVNTTRPPMRGLYPAQDGFGWTNSIFEALVEEFID